MFEIEQKLGGARGHELGGLCGQRGQGEWSGGDRRGWFFLLDLEKFILLPAGLNHNAKADAGDPPDKFLLIQKLYQNVELHGILILQMAVILFDLNIDDALDSQGVVFKLIADQAGDHDIFVVALDVDILVLYFFDLV